MYPQQYIFFFLGHHSEFTCYSLFHRPYYYYYYFYTLILLYSHHQEVITVHIQISPPILHEALQQIQKSLPVKPIMLILHSIKITATEHHLTFVASNGEQTSIYQFDHTEKDMPITIIKEGEIAVPAKFFVEIVRKLPQEMITLHQQNPLQLLIQSHDFKMSLQLYNALEYPQVGQHFQEAHSLQIQSHILKKMIRQTAFAASAEERNDITEGILWSWTKEHLKLFATNRQRLASIKIPFHTPPTTPQRFIVANRHLYDLYKVLPDEDIPVTIECTSQQIVFSFSRLKFFARLLNGSFPEVENIIETPFDAQIELDYQKFFQSIERSYILMKQENFKTLHFDINTNGLFFTSQMVEVGKIEEHLLIEKPVKHEKIFSINAKFLLDAIKAIEDPVVVIEYRSENRTAIKLYGKTDNQAIYLILPYHDQHYRNMYSGHSGERTNV